MLSFGPICNNNDAAKVCSELDRLFNAAANSSNVFKLDGALSNLSITYLSLILNILIRLSLIERIVACIFDLKS